MGGHGNCRPSLYPARAPSLGIQVGSPLLWVLGVTLWGTLDPPDQESPRNVLEDPCARHTVRPINSKHYNELGTEKGLLHIHTRRWVAHALRTPTLMKPFSKPPEKQKLRDGCG